MGNYISNIDFLTIILTNSYHIALDPIGFADDDHVFSIRYTTRNLLVKEHRAIFIDDFDICMLRRTCKIFKNLIDDYFRDAEVDEVAKYALIYHEPSDIVANISFKMGFGAPWWTMRQYVLYIKEEFLRQAQGAGLTPSDMNFNPSLDLDIMFKIMLIRGCILSKYSYTYAMGFIMIQFLDMPNQIYLAKAFAKCQDSSRMLAFLGIVARLPKKEYKLLFLRDFLLNMFSDIKFYKEDAFILVLKMMKDSGACREDSNLLKDPESELWLYSVFNHGALGAISYLYDNDYLDKKSAEFARLFPGMWSNPEYFILMSSLSFEMFQMVQYIEESLKVCAQCVRLESHKPFLKAKALVSQYNELNMKIIPPDIYVNKMLYKLKLAGEHLEKYGVEPRPDDFKIIFVRILKMIRITERSPWQHSKNALDVVMTEVFLAIVAKTKEVAIWEFFLESLLGPLRDCIQGKIMLPSLYASIVPPLKTNKGSCDYVSELIVKIISYVRLVEDNGVFQKVCFRESEYMRRQSKIIAIIKGYLDACKIKYNVIDTREEDDEATKKAKEIVQKLQQPGTPQFFGFMPFYVECFQEK